MSKRKPNKLPLFFKPLFWDVFFSSVDQEKHEKEIIVRTVNYGRWEHWRWILKKYGKRSVKEIVKNTPTSEFRRGGLRLVSILLGIKNFKYASRSIKLARS